MSALTADVLYGQPLIKVFLDVRQSLVLTWYSKR